MRGIVQSIDDKEKRQSSLIIFSNSDYSIHTLLLSLQYANPERSYNIIKI